MTLIRPASSLKLISAYDSILVCTKQPQYIQNGKKKKYNITEQSEAQQRCILKWHIVYFSTVKGDRAMAILQQTAFCTWVFELLSYSAWKKKKKKLSQDDPILGFYNPPSSSLQGLRRIFSAHDDSLV